MSKVTFDGPNKLIIINSGVTDIDVKDDIYLPWKQWVIDYGSMYLAALRTFGGDPTTTNQTAPTYYFLINYWKIKAENVNVTIKENLYSDDYNNPYIIINSSLIVKNSDIPRIDNIDQQLTGITSDLVIINNQLTGITETVDSIDQQITGITSDLVIINNQLTGITETLDFMWLDLKLILGLSQHNYRLTNHVYDSSPFPNLN